FVVPKFLVGDDGSLGARNGVSCGSIEEKMGIHANSTCVMNFDEATGWLIGEEHKGLRGMFTMMNEARLGVALQGLAISEVAYQNGAAYAKDRIQGRSLTGDKNPDGPADPIIVHPDVRRMLMDQRAFTEGARAFMLWSALQADLHHRSPEEETREKADDFLGLMTPILKAYFTEKGYWHCTNAQQVLGGHGYVREWGMEQFVRDARIAMIYEGANGIQALDLVGRKLMKDGGRAWQSLFAEMDEFAAAHEGSEELKPFIDCMRETKAQLEDATNWLGQNALTNFDHAGAGSMDYLHLFALTALSYFWAQMAKTALEKKAEGGDDPFYDHKLVTGRYFLERMTPDAAAHLAKIKSGADAVMALPAEAF
ncbi:MAG: acyl-CoA dehydrogenase C-terminal domain-containing protein, partial [Pseudomonadota bacterium]